MRLYHSSSVKLSVITPMSGEDRHPGEDPRAVGQPVVYLSTSDDEIHRSRESDEVATYKYIVEIDDNDPDLYLDEKDYQFRQIFNKYIEDSEEFDNTKWYFYLKPIKVSETLEWNGNRYIKRPNFD